mgnify:CR=1 FL=1
MITARFILNEVLSLNAQEFVLRSLIRAALLHDNEVLSLNAQEFVGERDCIYRS